MADIIRLLPDNIANQIAAGEVVQRPASVVKELLENAVDAGSTSIRLFVKDAGKKLIQVVDNGCGMSETDARMCFERHATSKIQQLDDLYAIHTLGFRGEAMASIAAVAQVELKTKRRNDEAGAMLQVENSTVMAHEPCACPDGTSIAVKNLFYNVPARRNFLKSTSVEMRHIVDEFQHVALANPDIQFVLTSEEEEVYHLKAGNLRQRIVALMGRKMDEGLVPVEEDTDILRIHGFIGKPDLARKRRGEQYFFANNRFIRNAYLNHAVVNAFQDLLPQDCFPFYAIFLELHPSRIDINVHPTKTEIKFEDEKIVYAILRSAIKKALSQHHIAPSLSFEDEPGLRADPSDGRISATTFPQAPAAGGSFGSYTQYESGKASRGDWQELYKVLQSEASVDGTATEEEEEDENESSLPDLKGAEVKPVMQLHQKYIITTLRSGLMLIHQQLAHERILFERYMEGMENHRQYSQRLLFPEVIHLSPADFSLVHEIMADMQSAGFELEVFGKTDYVVNAMPAGLATHEVKSLLEHIIEDYKHEFQQDKDNTAQRLAKALARNTAIQVGKVLAYEEMANLIDELFACKMPYYSPDGKPVLITIRTEELDKKFKK